MLTWQLVNSAVPSLHWRSLSWRTITFKDFTCSSKSQIEVDSLWKQPECSRCIWLLLSRAKRASCFCVPAEYTFSRTKFRTLTVWRVQRSLGLNYETLCENAVSCCESWAACLKYGCMHSHTHRFILMLFNSKDCECFDEKVELFRLHWKAMPLFSLCSDLVSHYIWIWILSLNEVLFLCPTVRFSLISSSPCLFASLSPSFAPSSSPPRSHNDLPALLCVSPALLFDVINLWERIRWLVVADWFVETYSLNFLLLFSVLASTLQTRWWRLVDSLVMPI